MYDRCTARRFPRAGIDRIDSPAAAQRLIMPLLAKPRCHETLVVLLDDERCGRDIANIDRTVDRDSVFHAADLAIERAHLRGDVSGVIIASVRPGDRDHLDDLDRWCELELQLDEAALELVEWFVIGNGVSCPRALLGAPSRWAA